VASCIIPPRQGAGGLYLSGLPEHKFHKVISNNNVKSVLSLYDKKIDYSQDFEHLQVFIDDVENANLDHYFDRCLEFIENQITTGNVLVHCFQGISRSSSIVIAFLMKRHKWSYTKALNFVRNQRSIAEPNEGFEK